MSGGASVEETLKLWARSLRSAKDRMAPLFPQKRVVDGGFEEPLFGKVGSYFSSFGVLIDCFCDGIRSAF